MKNHFLLVCMCLLLSFTSMGQQKDIVTIIDDLTVKWDYHATTIRTYKGMGHCCSDQNFRLDLIDLLNTIHHYDTSLYQIVSTKYEADKNKEAKATLEDIEKLEQDYATAAFLKFLHQECDLYNATENNYALSGGKEYQKTLKNMEKEIGKYVKAITYQIDIIDAHVHHLRDL